MMEGEDLSGDRQKVNSLLKKANSRRKINHEIVKI